MKELRFYSYAPIDYPFSLRNINQKRQKNVHEIIDIGVSELLKTKKYSSNKIRKWKMLDLRNDWKTVPDAPDIFKEFGHEEEFEFDNIKYSQDLLLDLYEPDDITQLPVIQGRYDDYESFKDYISFFKDNFKDPEKIGVGTMCKSGDRSFVEVTLRYIKKSFPNTWIHAFGLRSYHLPNSHQYINSWDSTAWTFPRGANPKRHSCKNKQERIDYFYDYLNTLPRLTNYNYELNENLMLEETLNPFEEYV